MNTQLNETQQMLRASAREFLRESCPPKKVRQMRTLPGGFSLDLWREMANLGWTGLALPEVLGGSEMPFLDLCLLIEELGYACLASPFIEVTAGAGPVLIEVERESTRELLQAVASGEALLLPALQGETGADGCRQLPLVRRDESARFVLDGAHLFVPHASAATHLLCLARSGDDAIGSVLLLLPASTAGVTIQPLPSAMDNHPCRVKFSAVRVPPEAVLASGDDADALVRRAVQRMDIARCCDIAGALTWVLEDTVTYAKDRRQFGQPIGSFQVLQHYCADMHVMLEGLKMAAAHAAWRQSEGLDAAREAAIACAWCHRIVPLFFGLAHQIHGAMGVTVEHDLHLYTTHAAAPGWSFAPLSTYLEAALTL